MRLLLESLVYFSLFSGFTTVLFGVDPLIAVSVNVLDMVWGSYLHLSNDFVREGRYGWLGCFTQTPAHHCVRHAKNARYLDRNGNSISLLWDWLLGTLEPIRDDEPVDYGITHRVDAGSYWDVHFGEFVALFRGLRSRRRVSEAFGYLFRPPDWRPGDPNHTAGAMRERLLANEARWGGYARSNPGSA